MFKRLAFGLAAISTTVLHANAEVFADLLVWCASEAGAENWGQDFTTEGLKTDIEVLTPSFGCDVGFRVGGSTCLCYDGWDGEASYTRFCTVGTGSKRTDGMLTSPFLGNFYINNADGTQVGPSYFEAKIRWRILLNAVDLQVGRHFCASRCLDLRPYVGLKIGQINQSIRSTWKHPTDPSLMFIKATEDLRNNFWGLGPMVGLDFDWYLGCNVSLFSDFSGALLASRWKMTDVYKNDQPDEVVIDLPKIHGAATMFRNFIGFAWGWQCWTIRLGYEAQIWLGQFKIYTLNQGRPDNVLTFQGGSLDVRLAF